MTGYILSILGIVVAGVFIDIIVPSGSINKYIRGIYSIFVVAVLVSPIMKLLNKTNDFTIKYEDY
ncbi:MAG: stage III sporulation protein AF, partial [Clostridia bacterium]|nr:stage III sporulation protein AF [Clostridia bacterium]